VKPLEPEAGEAPKAGVAVLPNKGGEEVGKEVPKAGVAALPNEEEGGSNLEAGGVFEKKLEEPGRENP
jgi:hypothetical protein